MNTCKNYGSYRRGNFFVAGLLLYLPIASNLMAMFIQSFLLYTVAPVDLMTVSLTIFQAVTLIIPIIIFRILTVQPFRCFLPVKKIDLVNLLLVVLICIFIQPFMMMVSVLSSAFFPNTTGAMFEQVSNIPLWVRVVGIAVIPALFEEIIMRGMILGEHRRLSFKQAAVLNGLFFGFMHHSPQQFLYAFLLGVIFAGIVKLTGSIIYTIVGHFVINLSQLLLFENALRSASQVTETVQDPANFMVSFLIMILVSVAVTGLLLKSLFNHNKKINENTPKTDEILHETETKQPIFDFSLWAVVGAYFISFLL